MMRLTGCGGGGWGVWWERFVGWWGWCGAVWVCGVGRGRELEGSSDGPLLGGEEDLIGGVSYSVVRVARCCAVRSTW